MIKPKKSSIEKIQTGKGKIIAKLFFLTYVTPSTVTKILYKDAWNSRNEKNKKRFVMPIIQNYLAEWKNEGFIDTSRIEIPFKVERKKGKPYLLKSYGYLFNFNAIFKYCKDKGIVFTNEEKSFLKEILLSEKLRHIILKEFLSDDIINATLKFYAKNFIIRYFILLRDIEENPEKYKLYQKKSKARDYPTTLAGKKMKIEHDNLLRKINEQYNDNHIRERKFNVIKAIAFSAGKTRIEDYIFQSYILQIENNPELIKSVDNKILKALDVLP